MDFLFLAKYNIGLLLFPNYTIKTTWFKQQCLEAVQGALSDVQVPTVIDAIEPVKYFKRINDNKMLENKKMLGKFDVFVLKST